MMRTIGFVIAAQFLTVFVQSSLIQADVFNMPAGQKNLEFVPIGDLGNADTSTQVGQAGGVSYEYRMGKYDVTAAQYTQFLNAVAKTDTYSLYNSNMAVLPTQANFGQGGAGIIRSGASGNYSYSVITGHENYPVTFVSWLDTARFANWIQNGQPTGQQGNATTEKGAYDVNGIAEAYTFPYISPLPRSPNAKYFLPTYSEWVKAGFYKGGGTNAGYWNYATQSNTRPSNVLSATGTNNANFAIDGYGSLTSPNITDPVNFYTPVGFFANSPSHYGTFDQNGDVYDTMQTIYPYISFDGYLFAGGSYWTHEGGDPESLQQINAGIVPDERNDIGFRLAALPVPEPASIELMIAALGILSCVHLGSRRSDD